MRKITISILIMFLLLLPRKNPDSAAAKALLSPAEVITAINQYRAQNGLYAYQSNSILMTTAQQHSNYQASIGAVTHTGAGGTRPIDRAYAAGYGNGQIVFVTEIIYGGTNPTVNDAVSWWKGSAIHYGQSTQIRFKAGVGRTIWREALP